MNLQIHLGERFVHVLDMLRGHLHQLLAMAHDGTHRTDLIFGPEGGAQQSHRMKELNPLTLVPVGAAARHVFHVPRIDEAGPETSLLEHLVHRNPIDASRFHRCGRDPAAL